MSAPRNGTDVRFRRPAYGDNVGVCCAVRKFLGMVSCSSSPALVCVVYHHCGCQVLCHVLHFRRRVTRIAIGLDIPSCRARSVVTDNFFLLTFFKIA